MEALRTKVKETMVIFPIYIYIISQISANSQTRNMKKVLLEESCSKSFMTVVTLKSSWQGKKKEHFNIQGRKGSRQTPDGKMEASRWWVGTPTLLGYCGSSVQYP